MARLLLSSVAALLLMVSSGAVATGQVADDASPMGTIKWSNDAVLTILSGQDPLGPEGEGEVYAVMDQVTDFRRMSGAAIDGLCEAGEDTCDEWKHVFGDLLRIRSIKGVGRYRAERFDYLHEEIDGTEAMVNCLAYYEGEEVTLDYKLERVDDKWFIVNYVVDDVDTARSYRRSFTRLLKKESVGDIIQRLRTRITEIQAET